MDDCPQGYGRFPRVRLAHLPTPLQRLERLEQLVGKPGLRLHVKRDDCTALGLGGNKVRKLEFLLGNAKADGFDSIITAGARHSNHVRQTAAAAAALGLACHAVLHDPVVRSWHGYKETGNKLLDQLFGASIHWVADEHAATDIAMTALASQLRDGGGTPTTIPAGGSNGLGALGYVECAQELLGQCADAGFQPDAIVLATGSGGTHAGLLAGLRLGAAGTQVVGISVSDTASIKRARVRTVLDELIPLLGIPQFSVEEEIIVYDEYAGAGYAVPSEAANAAVRTFAEHEGVLLDPVYTGKAAAGLLDLAARDCLKGNVVFLHTGGTPALFAYADEFVSPAGARAALRA